MNTSTLPKSLHIIDTTGPGGAETLFIDIAKHLIDESGQALALIRGPGWVEDTLKRKNIPYVLRDSKGSFNIGYLRFLCSLIASNKIEVIHTHLFGSSIYGSLAGMLTATPVISTFHGLVDIKPDERFVKTKLYIVRKAATIIAVSDAIKENLHVNYQLRSDEVTMIPNGINCEQFNTEKHHRLRETHSVPPDATILGALGNIRPAKDYATVINAVKILADDGIDAHLFIAGDPKKELLEPLKSQIAELRLEQRIHFLGFIDDANAFLSGLDIFVSSSSSEGQPLSIFQAMSKALPIVSTKSGVESFLQDGETAWLAPIKSPDELAKQLMKAIENPQELECRGQRAREVVLGQFNSDIMLNRYKDLYLSLTNNRPTA